MYFKREILFIFVIVSQILGIYIVLKSRISTRDKYEGKKIPQVQRLKNVKNQSEISTLASLYRRTCLVYFVHINTYM